MFEKFLSSAIRQVGRDLGKVVSNQIFRNAHSTPIRHINRVANVSAPNVGAQSSDGRRKTNFEKSLNFRMTYTPKTLVNKLAGAFIEFKNEANTLTWDGYLSLSETRYYLDMLQEFSEKAADVAELLEMNPKTSQNDMDYLTKITNDLTTHVRQVAKYGRDGAVSEIEDINRRLSEVETSKASNWMLLWLAMFVVSAIVGYFVWKLWVLFPTAVSGIGLLNAISTLSEKEAHKNRLNSKIQNETSVVSILDDLLENEAFK